MIILDMVRAGWKNQREREACLASFYSHLSRGLYVMAYEVVQLTSPRSISYDAWFSGACLDVVLGNGEGFAGWYESQVPLVKLMQAEIRGDLGLDDF